MKGAMGERFFKFWQRYCTAPLMLAAAFGLVYAGLVVQPYLQRMAGPLDRIQLKVGDEVGREQVRQYVASNYSFLSVLARDIRYV